MNYIAPLNSVSPCHCIEAGLPQMNCDTISKLVIFECRRQNKQDSGGNVRVDGDVLWGLTFVK